MSLKRLLGGFPVQFYVISFSGFMFHMGYMVTNPILTLHMQEVGATVYQIGTIFTIQSALLILLRMPLTLMARRIGERRMLSVAFMAQAVAQLFYGVAATPAMFYIIPAVQILATGTFFQIATAMNSNLAPPERQGEALGRHMTVMSLPMFVGPAICSVLIGSLGYRGMFRVSFLFPLAGLILFLVFTRDMETGGIEVPSHETPSLGSLRTLFSSRNVVVLALIRTLYSTSNNTFTTLFSLYAVNTLGFEPAAVAMLFSVQGVANTAVKIPVGAVSDRLGRKRFLLGTFAAVVLVYLALSRATTFLPIAAAIVVFGATWGARATVEWAFLTSLVEPRIKNIAVSYMESFWDVGSMLGSYLAGLLSGFMAMPAILMLLAAINAPAIPAILAMKEESNVRKG
ncbi:MFS transporter [Candidatus Bathyarchaeota archaeon]|nr:MFS transporter [Candidatus Bathyarchaeota archaeon]